MDEGRRQILLASSLYDGIEHCNLRHVMTVLHDKKGDPNFILPKRGISPFHLAVGSENCSFAEDVTRLLLQFGGHPNIRSVEGMTPVHIAAAWGHTNLLHLLLLSGGDPWLIDDEGNDAFDYAHQGCHTKTTELLQRFQTLDAKSSHFQDSTPQYKISLDKVMLYNHNAILEYKADGPFSTGQSRRLKSATTQTSPSDGGPDSHADVNVMSNDGWNTFETNRLKYCQDYADKPMKNFDTVIADLKDSHVTLRRGQRKKVKNTDQELGVNSKESKPTEEETCRIEKNLFEELLEAENNQGNNEPNERVRYKDELPEWQLNSVKTPGKAPSALDLTHVEEVDQCQPTTQPKIKSVKSANFSVKSFAGKIGRLLPSKKQSVHFPEMSFLKELKECQATNFKNMKKALCPRSRKTPKTLIEELRERQAVGLRGNEKQMDLEASQTQLITDEIMVQVNPGDDSEVYQPLVNEDDDVSEASDDMQILEPQQIFEPSQRVDCIESGVNTEEQDVVIEYGDDQVPSPNVSTSRLGEVSIDSYKSTVPYHKLYGFTAPDPDTFDENPVTNSEENVETSPNVSSENIAPASEPNKVDGKPDEILDLAPSPSEEIEESFQTVDISTEAEASISVEEVFPEPEKASSEVNDDAPGESNTLDSPYDELNSVGLDAKLDRSSSSDHSECLNDDEHSQDGYQLLTSPHSVLSEVTKECPKTIASEIPIPKISGSSKVESEVQNPRDSKQSIFPGKDTFCRNLNDFPDTRATSTMQQCLDLDDWMTMDWMDHDEPLKTDGGLKFIEEQLISSDEDIPLMKDIETDRSLLTDDLSKSNRSSPEYFTCNEDIQTLARYPGGRPKVGNVARPKTSHGNSVSFETSRQWLEDNPLTRTTSNQLISINPAITDPSPHNRTSSSLSGDSFVSVSEDYIYTDEEEGVVLLERRYLVPEPLETSSELGPSGDSSGGSGSYDTDTLRSELRRRGLDPGPIIPSTKRVYVRKLRRLAREPAALHDDKPVYSAELEKTIRVENWYLDLSPYENLEHQVSVQFAMPDPTRHWREGVVKSSFCYLLLDPRITCNLPCRTDLLTQSKIWSTFLDAIFYVGKGKRSRPYSHLYQAVSVWKSGAATTDDKIQYILDIWKDGLGVVCLHIFQNTIPVEAYTREASMIDALMLRNIKNSRLSEYYGVAATWTSHHKKLLGVSLLRKAMLIFLSEGERQLRPADIGTKN